MRLLVSAMMLALVTHLTASSASAQVAEHPFKLMPLGDRVLVELLPPDAHEIFPESAKERPNIGAVIAVGQGIRSKTGEYIPLHVSVGDRVMFGKWAGTDLSIVGRYLLLMKESDILAIVVPGE